MPEQSKHHGDKDRITRRVKKQLDTGVLLITGWIQDSVPIEHPLGLLFVTADETALIRADVELIVLPVNEPYAERGQKDHGAGKYKPAAARTSFGTGNAW